MSDGLHPAQRIHEALVLSLFERLDQNLTILRCGVLIDFKTDTICGTELRPGTHSCGFDGFILHAVSREERKRSHREKADEKRPTGNEPVNLRRGKSNSMHFPSLGPKVNYRSRAYRNARKCGVSGNCEDY